MAKIKYLCPYCNSDKIVIKEVGEKNNMEVIRECDIFNDDSAEIVEVEEEKPKDE